MNNKISVYYLAHFIYIPLALGYSLYIGEGTDVLFLVLFLSVLVSIFAYAYNYIITVLTQRLFKSKKILPFLLPVILLLIMYVPVNYLLKKVDFGGEYALIIFLVTSAVINVTVFGILKSKQAR